MTDDEDRLKRLLNEAIDAEGGNRPVPGPFRSERVSSAGAHGRAQRPRPWLLPLAAAACVAAIAGIAVAAADAGSNSAAPADTGTATVHSSNPPSSASPSAASTPSASASSRPATSSSHRAVPPAATSTSPTSSSPSTSTTWTTQRIGDAQIAVPPGWEVRSGDTYAPVHQLYQWEARHTYCLTPSTQPSLPVPDITDCPILFAPIDFPAPDDGYTLAPDDPGGITASRSPYCNGATPAVTGNGGERTFGGRAAEYRRLDYRCPGSGKGGTVEQYEVLTRPAYLVVGQVDQSGVPTALAGVVSRTRLPAQNQSVRLRDYGYLRKVTPLADGVKVQLQRVVRASGAAESSTLYEYTIPQETLDMNNQHPVVGQLAAVYSDGRLLSTVRIQTYDMPPAY